MKSNKFGLLGALFAGAMAACSATSCQAATVVNFDDVSAPLSGAAVTSYLAGYGITFTAPPAFTPNILAYPAGGNPFLPVSAPNYFAVGGTSFKLLFSTPLDSLSFTVPGTGSTSTMAAWSATAFAAGAVQLSQVGNGPTAPNSSAQTYILTGPEIVLVAFSETVGTAGNFLAFDDLTVTPTPTPLPAALPLFATGLGALGLLSWRRKRKNAVATA